MTLKLNSKGRHILTIIQQEFIAFPEFSGLDSGKIPQRAEVDERLTPEQQGELRAVALRAESVDLSFRPTCPSTA